MKLRMNLLLLTILILVSCNKLELKEVNSAYEGEWHSLPVVTALGNTVDTYIIIDGDQGNMESGVNSALTIAQTVFRVR